MKFKICGIKNEAEALAVASLNIDFLGVIFASSKRKVTPEMAKKIAEISHKNGKKCVGIFTNEKSEAEILEICDFARLDAVQIYFSISAEFAEILRAKNIEIWRVLSVLNEIPNFSAEIFDRLLFDYKGQNLGGNGESFDFKILQNFKEKNPEISFIIAGGISAKNAKETSFYKPYALDINSKVEDENGIKSVDKILEILEILNHS